MNLYVANHIHHLEGEDGTWVGDEEKLWVGKGPKELVQELLDWCTREEWVVSVEWREKGDLVVW